MTGRVTAGLSMVMLLAGTAASAQALRVEDMGLEGVRLEGVRVVRRPATTAAAIASYDDGSRVLRVTCDRQSTASCRFEIRDRGRRWAAMVERGRYRVIRQVSKAASYRVGTADAPGEWTPVSG